MTEVVGESIRIEPTLLRTPSFMRQNRRSIFSPVRLRPAPHLLRAELSSPPLSPPVMGADLGTAFSLFIGCCDLLLFLFSSLQLTLSCRAAPWQTTAKMWFSFIISMLMLVRGTFFLMEPSIVAGEIGWLPFGFVVSWVFLGDVLFFLAYFMLVRL